MLSLIVLLGIAVAEVWGWPFLAAPLEQALSKRLGLRVSFAADPATDLSQEKSFQLRLLGGARLAVERIEVSAPVWSGAPQLLLARNLTLDLSLADAWRAYQGRPFSIRLVTVKTLDVVLERTADGRISTPFLQNAMPPSVERWGIDAGTLRYRDERTKIDVVANLHTAAESALAPEDGDLQPKREGVSNKRKSSVAGRATVDGTFRGQPLTLAVHFGTGAAPGTTDVGTGSVPFNLTALLGETNLALQGSMSDERTFSSLTAQFSLAAPSAALFGDAMGIAMPSTNKFISEGVVVKKGDTWYVVVNKATSGRSEFRGAFTYETGSQTPLLSGQLIAARLLLGDLGPMIGNASATARTTVAKFKGKPNAQAGRTLPHRHFDLAVLRAMSANVLIDVDEVQFNTPLLERIRPLHAHLQLSDSILSLTGIETHSRFGRLQMSWTLDAKEAIAEWSAKLRWEGVQLEHWLKHTQGGDGARIVSGRVEGNASLRGRGRSTAEILATLSGHIHGELHNGLLSRSVADVIGTPTAVVSAASMPPHDSVRILCAAADLEIDRGVVRPRLAVAEMDGFTAWIAGTLSLATETIDLRLLTAATQSNPRPLHTPLQVTGSFAAPNVVVSKVAIAAAVANSFFTALFKSVAALIPGNENNGNVNSAKQASSGCRAADLLGTATVNKITRVTPK